MNRFYFSTHSMARDVIANLAPFTLFALGLVLLFPRLRGPDSLLVSIYGSGLWTITISVWAATIFVAYASTTIVAIVVNWILLLIHRAINRSHENYRWPARIRGPIGKIYDEHASTIDALHTNVFGTSPVESAAGGWKRSSQDKLDDLRSYLETYNPSGISALYRRYARIAVIKGCGGFALLLMCIVPLAAWTDLLGPMRIRVLPAEILLGLVAVCCFWWRVQGVRRQVSAELGVVITGMRLARDAAQPRADRS